MKKVILMAALAAGVFSSCNNNELEGVQSNEAGKASINAVIEGSESRAGFESKTQWQDNDKLGLFMYKATDGAMRIRNSPARTTRLPKMQVDGALQQICI